MRATQNYRCFVCKVHELTLKYNLCVDHNHITGRVRALLCDSCNFAEGILKTAANARALADYMDKQALLDKLTTIL
jgi:hypothetical protein